MTQEAHLTNTEWIFKDQSKEDWQARALKELKGKEYHEIEFDLEDGSRLDPLYTADEIPKLPPIPWPAKTWRIVEPFHISASYDTHALNDQILASLEGGAEVLHFEIDENVKTDWVKVLEGVHLEMIGMTSSNMDSGILPYARAYAVDQGISQGDLDIRVPEVHDVPIQDSTSDRPSQRLVVMAADIRSAVALDRSAFHRIQIQVTVNLPFFQQIAYIRALKLLCHRIRLDWSLEGLPTIRAVIGEDMHTKDLEILIERTVKASSAVLAGVDECLIESLWPNEMNLNKRAQRRITRNIHWLLKEEAGLIHVCDPMRGAHFIEKCTAEYFELALRSLNEMERM